MPIVYVLVAWVAVILCPVVVAVSARGGWLVVMVVKLCSWLSETYFLDAVSVDLVHERAEIAYVSAFPVDHLHERAEYVVLSGSQPGPASGYFSASFSKRRTVM